MAQLKDLIVNGPSRFVGNITANDSFTLGGPLTASGGSTLASPLNGTGAKVISEAIASLIKRIESLEDSVDSKGDLSARSITSSTVYKINNDPLFRVSSETPSTAPDFIGQLLIVNTSNPKLYYSFGDSSSSDWTFLLDNKNYSDYAVNLKGVQTITGNKTFNSNVTFNWGVYHTSTLFMGSGSDGIYLTSNSINWHNPNNVNQGSLFSFSSSSITSYKSIYPSSDNALYLGDSGHKWNNIYTQNASIASLNVSSSLTIGGVTLTASNGILTISGLVLALNGLTSATALSESSGTGSLIFTGPWSDYTSEKSDYALAASLGYDLHTRVTSLERKATNVKFTQVIAAGKQIGTISIDGASTNLYAPSTYAWSEITSKPTFAKVATSGSYSDLTNKPTIASLMGSTAIGGTSSYIYWNGSAWAIKALGSNAFTSISKVSQLTNDSRYITGITKDMVEGVLIGNITSHTHSYLPLSGGTITGGSGEYTPLVIKTNSLSEVWIQFRDINGTTYIGRANGVPSINSGGLNQTIIHTGNIGSQVVKGLSMNYVDNLDNAAIGELFTSGFQAANRPLISNYATGLTIYNQQLNYNYQLAFSTNAEVFVRYKNSSAWQSWKQIAFTDSNVASATKLATSRTIWGQSFDGTGNVSGMISNAGDIIPATTHVSNLGSSSSVWERLYGRYIDTDSGYYLRLCAGGTEIVTITDSSAGSNVGIGTTSPQYKLDVNGTGRFTGAVTMASTLTVGGNITPNTNNAYALGTPSYQWSNLYAIRATLSGNASINGTLGVSSKATLYNGITLYGSLDGTGIKGISESIASLIKRVESLEDSIDSKGDLSTRSITSSTVYKINNDPLFKVSTATPSTSPDFVGQLLIRNTSDPRLFYAFGNSSSSEWTFVLDYKNYSNYAVNLDGNQTITGIKTFNNNVTFNKHVSHTSTLNVSGAATFTSTLNVSGRATLAGGITSKADHDFINHGNEFNFIPDSYSGILFVNRRTASGSQNGGITEYDFCQGVGGTYADIRCKNIYATGNTLQIGSATLTWNGSALVVDKPLVSTSFAAGATATASSSGGGGSYGPVRINVTALSRSATSVPQSTLDSYGLTATVIENMADGLYTKVVDTQNRASWTYEAEIGGTMKTVCIRRGDTFDINEGISMRSNDNGSTWTIIFKEI